MPTPSNKLSQCRLHVKLATIQFCLQEHQSVADQVVQAISCLSVPSISEDEVEIIEEKHITIPDAPNPEVARKGGVLTAGTVRPRHVYYLSMNRQSILAYCTKILIDVFKDKALQANVPITDMAIGHAIVLLQVVIQ